MKLQINRWVMLTLLGALAIVALAMPNPMRSTEAQTQVIPTEAVVSAASQQRFEKGYMLWHENSDSIYVLYANSGDGCEGTWEILPDNWDESMGETDPSIVPPAGKTQPMRGIGLAWRSNPNTRTQLGWALAPEAGYTMLSYTNDTTLWLSAQTATVFILDVQNRTWWQSDKFYPPDRCPQLQGR